MTCLPNTSSAINCGYDTFLTSNTHRIMWRLVKPYILPVEIKRSVRSIMTSETLLSNSNVVFWILSGSDEGVCAAMNRYVVWWGFMLSSLSADRVTGVCLYGTKKYLNCIFVVFVSFTKYLCDLCLPYIIYNFYNGLTLKQWFETFVWYHFVVSWIVFVLCNFFFFCWTPTVVITRCSLSTM